jgi:hypothetical protein
LTVASYGRHVTGNPAGDRKEAEMKRLIIVLAAAVMLAVPAGASAMVIDPGGGGGSTSGCTSGMLSEGSNGGSIPDFRTNSLVQVSVRITNLNVLGFTGSVDISTYPSSKVSRSFFLWPYQSITITGPTYTTPWSNTRGVPFNIALWPGSDAYALAYQACV